MCFKREVIVIKTLLLSISKCTCSCWVPTAFLLAFLKGNIFPTALLPWIHYNIHVITDDIFMLQVISSFHNLSIVLKCFPFLKTNTASSFFPFLWKSYNFFLKCHFWLANHNLRRIISLLLNLWKLEVHCFFLFPMRNKKTFGKTSVIM